MQRVLNMLLLAGLAALVGGCGGNGPTTEVSGKVTYEGKSVTSGLINFMPDQGRPLGGGIQPDGTYSFEAPPGNYQVRIDAPAPLPEGYKEGDPLPNAPRLVPEKFANYGSSGLTATVTDEGGQTIDFNLSQ
jgi:hypothetical protein